MKQRIENFHKALARFNEAVIHFSANPSDEFARDALIQRFEFTFELAWKCLAEHLHENGNHVQKMPRPVLKECYSVGLIKNEAVWLEILKSRNLTSHIYDEETANLIAMAITKTYTTELNELSKVFA